MDFCFPILKNLDRENYRKWWRMSCPSDLPEIFTHGCSWCSCFRCGNLYSENVAKFGVSKSWKNTDISFDHQLAHTGLGSERVMKYKLSVTKKFSFFLTGTFQDSNIPKHDQEAIKKHDTCTSDCFSKASDHFLDLSEPNNCNILKCWHNHTWKTVLKIN